VRRSKSGRVGALPPGTLSAVQVTFFPGERGGSVAVIARADGVRLRLRSYDRKAAVPHDLVHFVAERAFGLRQGVWGSIADGVMFGSMDVVSGRLRHDSRQRSQSVLRANKRELGLAELLSDVVYRGLHQDEATLARELDRTWGVLREGPCPYTPAQARAAVTELAALAEQWTVTTADQGLTVTWPSRRQARRR
jgi:hypothetical protein